MDERCSMELDDINPASWGKLLDAVREFCVAHGAALDEVAELLLAGREPQGREGSGSEAGGWGLGW